MHRAIFFSKLQQEERNHSIPVLPESSVMTSCRDSVHRRESPIRHNTNSRRPQTTTTGSHQQERPVTSSRQEDRAAQMKSIVHRQPPNHPQLKLSENVSCPKCVNRVCTSRTLLYSQQQACKMTLNLPGPHQWQISHLLLYSHNSVHLQHFEHPDSDTFTSL